MIVKETHERTAEYLQFGAGLADKEGYSVERDPGTKTVMLKWDRPGDPPTAEEIEAWCQAKDAASEAEAQERESDLAELRKVAATDLYARCILRCMGG